MESDRSLQIFLTLYHGQLLGTFFYDLIIRNCVRLFYDKLEWNMVTQIALGVFYIFAILWAVLSVWRKIRLNLIISSVILLVILVARIVVGTTDIIDKRKYYDNRNYHIELAVFIAQIVVHSFGVVATFVLASRVSKQNS
jgi:hypothetical protein